MPAKDRAPGTTSNVLASDLSGGRRTVTAPFGHALIDVAERDERVVGLTADLGKYTDMHLFAARFPGRFFQLGMAEQNLMGVAAGLARSGFVPVATTYAVFATRRAYDFIAMGAAIGRQNVKIVAGLPGITTGYGGTHQGIEDIALMRAMPNLVVIDPCDATETYQTVSAIIEYDGPVYMRLLRGEVPVVMKDDYRFEIGRNKLMRRGADVAIVSAGLMTGRALDASAQLAAAGVEASVLHVSTLKPFDSESVCELASTASLVVTVENHTVHGGLGTAVAEALQEAEIPIRLRRIGLPDEFCESGSTQYLFRRYGLDPESIAARILQLVDIKPA